MNYQDPSVSLDEALSDGGGVENIEQAIDFLIEGKYRSVPESEGRICKKLKQLADVLHERAAGEVRLAVEISMNSSNAVTATAGMIRDVREVDSRTQSISSAAEEMVASVQEISFNAQAADNEAKEADAAASTAMKEAQSAMSTMENISNTVTGAAEKADGLSEASEQIGEIVSQIDAIAKQTNLLALNATIEAARAGEMGKGFAVVANEVKNLANQTSKATEDIRQRIDQLRTEISSILTALQEGSEAVENGRGVINATGDAMQEVTAKIATVTHKVGEISAILTQQTAASNEISEGITTIALMSGNNVEAINHIIDLMGQGEGVIVSIINELNSLEIHDFTVHVAKSDHMIWRKKLAEMAAGRISLNPDELADHHHCRLGKWYDALQDPDIKGHPAYAALEPPHREVHAKGIEAARKMNAGDLDGAVHLIQNDVETASHKVLELLDELANR